MNETKQLSRREENFEVSSPRDLLQSATNRREASATYLKVILAITSGSIIA